MRPKTVCAVFAIAATGTVAGCGAGDGSYASAPPSRISTNASSHVHLLQVRADGSVVLGDEEGLWHVSSAGGSWTPTGPPLNRMMVTCLARTTNVMVACTTTYSTKFLGLPRGAWRSTDGGKHWRRAALPGLDVVYMASNPRVPGVVAAFVEPDSASGGAGNGGIWVSRDAGMTWARVNKALATALQPIGLALLPGRPFALLFATTSAIHGSVDGGRTWSINNLDNNPVVSLAVSPVQPGVVFAGAFDGIWKSVDAGRHWHLYQAAPPTSTLAPAYDSVGDLYGYASVAKPYIYRVRSGHVFRGTVPSSGGTLVMSVDPQDPARIYAAWSFPLRIYESNDGGVVWRKIL